MVDPSLAASRPSTLNTHSPRSRHLSSHHTISHISHWQKTFSSVNKLFVWWEKIPQHLFAFWIVSILFTARSQIGSKNTIRFTITFCAWKTWKSHYVFFLFSFFIGQKAQENLKFACHSLWAWLSFRWSCHDWHCCHIGRFRSFRVSVHVDIVVLLWMERRTNHSWPIKFPVKDIQKAQSNWFGSSANWSVDIFFLKFPHN